MGRIMGSGKYPMRYINPITGAISPTSQYVNEQGIKKQISTKYQEYEVNGEWLKSHLAPHVRETIRKILNTKQGYMLYILRQMGCSSKQREKKRQISTGRERVYR